MHLLVPFASDGSEACRHVVRDLDLPHLGRLLAALDPAGVDAGEASSLSPPHERALAAARGWQGGDGLLPFAAHAAAADGIDVGEAAWGLLTPAHWSLGSDHAAMVDPAQVVLGDEESRALFASLRPLFETEGFTAAWGVADRWYVGGPALAAFPTASLDRVIGRNVDAWLGETRSPTGRLVRRLQSEAQLLLHSHPVNEAREERGEPAINSVWLSGCGPAQPADPAREPGIDTRLRAPLFAGDWAAWADAWRALDAEAIARLAPDTTTLTLCGDRRAARFTPGGGGLLRRLSGRFRRTDPHLLLETL